MTSDESVIPSEVLDHPGRIFEAGSVSEPGGVSVRLVEFSGGAVEDLGPDWCSEVSGRFMDDFNSAGRTAGWVMEVLGCDCDSSGRTVILDRSAHTSGFEVEVRLRIEGRVSGLEVAAVGRLMELLQGLGGFPTVDEGFFELLRVGVLSTSV